MPSERSEGREGRFNAGELGRMVRVENATCLLLIERQLPRELGIADPGIAYGEIHGCLQRHGRWDAHGTLASLGSARHRNIPLVIDASGNGFLQRIRRLPEGIRDTLSLRMTRCG